MGNDEEKLKVKQLPESERKELLAEMEKAGLRGVKEEYKVITAKAAIKKWKAEQSPGDNSNKGEQSGKTEDVNKNTENVNETAENVNKNTKTDKKEQKPLICHVCRGEVYNGICSKCGFTLHSAKASAVAVKEGIK